MKKFIEYISKEIKGKRLTKQKGISLIREVYQWAETKEGQAPLHPLMHRNESNLEEQKYRSTFTGNEPFLRDHQIRFPDGNMHKVLPGVAYLEMARAAVSKALPALQDPVIEIHGATWLRPMVVDQTTQAEILLNPSGDRSLEFTVQSVPEDGAPVVHCQGSAHWLPAKAGEILDLEKIGSWFHPEEISSDRIYAEYRRMGVDYGETHRTMESVRTDGRQALVRLRLSADKAAGGFLLPPGLMDGALQSGLALMLHGGKALPKPVMPFSLDRIAVFAPCAEEMIAWVRYAETSGPEDVNPILDLDLCDKEGKVGVQLRGLCSRAAGDSRLPDKKAAGLGTVYSYPVWRDIGKTEGEKTAYGHRILLLCGLPEESSREAVHLLEGGNRKTLSLPVGGDPAAAYLGWTLACFSELKAALAAPSREKILFQVAGSSADSRLAAGLSGMLMSAAQENPKLAGQVILLNPDASPAEIAARISACETAPGHSLLRWDGSALQGRQLEEMGGTSQGPQGPQDPVWRENGVYLITGGFGGLGRHFVADILGQTQGARILLIGRSPLAGEKAAELARWNRERMRVEYLPADIADPEAMLKCLGHIGKQYGKLSGILHGAGLTRDGFILKKEKSQVEDVLKPKVLGTRNLLAFLDRFDLDFISLFSSSVAVGGNPGQSDYAAANGYLDALSAALAEDKAAASKTRILSINWPYWKEGGMRLPDAALERIAESTGLHALETAAGIEAFHAAMHSGLPQVQVWYGEPSAIRDNILSNRQAEPEADEPAGNAAQETGKVPDLQAKTVEYLKSQVSQALKIAPSKLDPRAGLDRYGINSIVAINLTNQLEKTFGTLPKTLFFEYQNIQALSEYFLSSHGARLAQLLGDTGVAKAKPQQAKPAPSPVSGTPRFKKKILPKAESPSAARDKAGTGDGPIAIIGLSGRYPKAANLAEYWDNLKHGRDCIEEIPRDRWDWREYYSSDRSQAGRHYSKWGGFISGVDEFDPLFFQITPLEAEMIDPQERLFLQHAWMAMEDAGYTRSGLQVPRDKEQAGQVGVYVGVMYGEYNHSGSLASIANRVSYTLNLHGPCMTVDTMCSSSLTAIHLACQDLRSHRTDLGIAGGVNVTIDPSKYAMLSMGQFISSDGHCQSFGEGGDGYIPGEGVGAVLLKRLPDAIKDGDHIHALIMGSALNHGGKTNGFTVPNPGAQTCVIRQAFQACGIDPGQVGYLEAHGTGTKLGDPIEITALAKAFQGGAKRSSPVLVGSAKSNIGHCESAAGIAGLTKILLQLKHRQIAPSLHSARLNPNIDFSKTPFIVNQELKAWDKVVMDGRESPRTAGISSFGAGGSNAHLIIQEFEVPAAASKEPSDELIVLSARTEKQLVKKAQDLAEFLRREEASDLKSLAYTLQVGREALEFRLGFIASTREQAIERLRSFAAGETSHELMTGQATRHQDAISLFDIDEDLQKAVQTWIENGKLDRLLDLWVKGLEVDWKRLHPAHGISRISLPPYPFAKEKYWKAEGRNPKAGNQGGAIHPLVHRNVSNLEAQRYESTFTGSEFFLQDHQVKLEGPSAVKTFPAAAYLEMVAAAARNALPEGWDGHLELADITWNHPITVEEEKRIWISLSAEGPESLSFKVHSDKGGEETPHCSGRVSLKQEEMPANLDLESLRRQGDISLDPKAIYARFEAMGIRYGRSFRPIQSYRGTGSLGIASLLIEKSLESGLADYFLHPSLLDGSLQACMGLMASRSDADVPGMLPFHLDSLSIHSAFQREMTVLVRYREGAVPTGGVVTLDIDICDNQGKVCAELRGFAAKTIPSATPTSGVLLAHPVWKPFELDQTAAEGGSGFLLFGFPESISRRIRSQLGSERCQTIPAPAGDLAASYEHFAAACFREVQSMLLDRTRARKHLQICIPDGDAHLPYAGISGLLKTAALEDPSFIGQLVLVDSESDRFAETLASLAAQGAPGVYRCQGGRAEAEQWMEILSGEEKPANPFRDEGVYLLTGGLGQLGRIFAREIAAKAKGAKVILTGRSSMTAEQEKWIAGLNQGESHCEYRQLEFTGLETVRRFIEALRDDHGRLDGVLHIAGMVSDNFLAKKSETEFRQVLQPKVFGTHFLDEATRDLQLDFFALFSSVAGAMGNMGQADYAAANAFMDRFAAYRNALAAQGQRSGRTRSINWPLWADGGMGVDQATMDLISRTVGMIPMGTENGLKAFASCLQDHRDQTLVAEGNREKIRQTLFARPRKMELSPVLPSAAPEAAGAGDKDLKAAAENFLQGEFCEVLKISKADLDIKKPLEAYGIDSILAMRLTARLEESFGQLPKTLFFEYQSIAELASYFARRYPQKFQGGPGPKAAKAEVASAGTAPAYLALQALKPRFQKAPRRIQDGEDIAIVGIAGRYPMSGDLEEFWENLKLGKDCVTEIPEGRWEVERFFHPEKNQAGKSYSKWGGFIPDVDKFDAGFFNISPKEAELIDPQERLFLQTAWETLEEAGYSKGSVSGRNFGVYVGAMWGQYQLLGSEAAMNGGSAVTSSSYASIANRVSYFFNWTGPSIALDTMCSSSLTAIHLACEEIRKGEIEGAIAGGVNVSIHPNKYLNLSQGSFVASDGKCRSFGKGGDGYVPGEGIGAVFLKPLAAALADGDHIHAVIKATAINHGGKTNGYTVPSPKSQASLIRKAVEKARIDPRTLGYIEAHGTGTSLGDPIEIAGLTQALEEFDLGKQSCPVGSVKSNIGHLESAAGMAALTKVLLQLKHGELVPTLHADTLNPNIDFESSPFYVQRENSAWTGTREKPRRAAISSFGAGGSNGHIIVEEYAGTSRATVRPAGPSELAFVFSARDKEGLAKVVARQAAFLQTHPDLSPQDLAYTLQVGRTALNERLLVIATGSDDLIGKLASWLDAKAGDEVFQGRVKDKLGETGSLLSGEEGGNFVRDLLQKRNYRKLASLWIMGVEIDWSSLYAQAPARRLALPTYPFRRDRHWIETKGAPQAPPAKPAGIGPGPEENRRSLHYAPAFAARALPPVAGARLLGPILVLDASDRLFQALRNQIQDPAQVILAGIQGENGYAELLDQYQKAGTLPRYVVHRHDGNSAEAPFYPLFHLGKAMIERKWPGTRILSIHSDGKGLESAFARATAGFFRTLVLEAPKFQGKCIGIPESLRTDGQEARIVLDELLSEEWGPGEIRYVPSAKASPTRLVSALAPVQAGQGPLPLKHKGVYLLSGGLGGLGLTFGNYLLEKFQARLVLIGRSELKPEKRKVLDRMNASGGEAIYLQADVTREEDVIQAVRTAKARFGQVNGIIHGAGTHKDNFLLRKTASEAAGVLGAKVQGTVALDAATRNEDLDLFVLFSSAAGVFGNPGQIDYAYGNSFMDAFAEARENEREQGRRKGRTVSISWPYWEKGGMQLSASEIELAEKLSGMSPLPDEAGIRLWEDALRLERIHSVPLYGFAGRIQGFLSSLTRAKTQELPAQADAKDEELAARTCDFLKSLVSTETKMPADQVDPLEKLEAFGIDSVMINNINARLEKEFGAIPKTLFYEHETIQDLVGYFVREHRPRLARMFALPETTPFPVPAPEAPAIQPSPEARTPMAFAESEPIAIVGIDGRFPKSADLDAYWENLKGGKSLIDLVPKERWDCEEFFDPDPSKAKEGKIYCKWGGFLEDADKFDAPFFNIPESEAEIMDPQERLTLMSVWRALENAGYTRASLKKKHPRGSSSAVGVFFGTTTNSYQMLAPDEWSKGNAVTPGSMPWSIPNRVSYFFDFKGPSLPVDTACSSSSVAIHMACESLRKGECEVAVAGGVNLYLHPYKYQSFCQRRMISTDDRNRSYGAGDQGFVPGEAVGTVILKPLSAAKRDGDPIQAVIRSSAFEHSGRSNGFSAPNPKSQADLIHETMVKAGIGAETIGYVEGHGTGTRLGDSLEVASLQQAFLRHTSRRAFCSLGSVKSNVGHSESAAGISGLAKILLQMKHGKIAPSLGAEEVNPDIDFAESPFFLQKTLGDWPQGDGRAPKRALLNSFGAGGVNACLLVEEYIPGDRAVQDETPGESLTVLSAHTRESLLTLSADLARYLARHESISLPEICHTLQVGREHLRHRLAIRFSTRSELLQALKDREGARVYASEIDPSLPKPDLAAALEARDWHTLAMAWVRGAHVPWEKLYAGRTLSRLPLPMYPFAKHSHWIETRQASGPSAPNPAKSGLHPLVTCNSSSFSEIGFTSFLSESACHAADHVVKGRRILPGSALLEMACVSANLAGRKKVAEVRDLVWSLPLELGEETLPVRTVLNQEQDAVSVRIFTLDMDNEERLHAESRIVYEDPHAAPHAPLDRVDLEALKRKAMTYDGRRCYAEFEKFGIQYGPAFRTIQEMSVGESFALARLAVPDPLISDFYDYILHPALLDGAFQTLIGLGKPETASLHIPFAVGAIEIKGVLPPTCYALARFAEKDEESPSAARVATFDVDLINEDGEALTRIRKFYARIVENTLQEHK